MREICNEYRVKQVSERSNPANFIAKSDEFINLSTGFVVVVVVVSLLVNLERSS